ncbi:MAG: ribonuclease HI family protein [Candidatus Abawacabacteria bacterium]|nr:ribonuclease HI family protein [Candidatus Abawacabacteria bacterium]
MIFALYTDGGARGNPGPAAWGFVIYQNRNLIAQGSGYLGHTTNNVAEYTACVEGLRHIKNTWGLGHTIHCYADSQLLIEQLNGRYKVKAAHLKPLIETIHALTFEQTVTFDHIRREKNTEADKLVNITLDKQPPTP